MFNDKGKPVTEAHPGEAVEVIGWREIPHAGEDIIEVESEVRRQPLSKTHYFTRHVGFGDMGFITDTIDFVREISFMFVHDSSVGLTSAFSWPIYIIHTSINNYYKWNLHVFHHY